MPVHMNRAGAAKRNAAAVLSSGELQRIAQNPKQWHVGLGLNRLLAAV
jgi:hypothetical protein